MKLPVGRFAPSPTGDLHFGSLVAAVASFLHAKSRGGRWLVRVENIDPPREVAGSADRILMGLQRFGLRSDEPVLFQESRRTKHRKLVNHLVDRGQAYWCGCSRKALPPSGVYPGTCRDGLPRGKKARAVRLRVSDDPVVFQDRIQGEVRETLSETTGDFVIWRADDLPAYQLAVVADDAFQGVTEVVRGFDLVGSTCRQVHVANCLGFDVPDYAHHPVVVTPERQKLSKQLGSDPIVNAPRARTLEAALRFLGQPCPPDLELDEMWEWARANWDLQKVPRTGQAEATYPQPGRG